ncbi:MAG: tetratricopeptide repeat protein [Flavobacteriales bacterium]
MKKRLLSIIFLVFTLSCFAQTNIKRLDSLLYVSKSQKEISLISTLNEISWEFKNVNNDSAFYYARKALKISKKTNSKKAIAFSYNSLASCFENIGELDSALVYHQKSLAIKLEIENNEGVADSYNNIGIVYDLKGDYAKSLENYFEALKIYESEDVPFDKAPMVLSNIGIVYKKQKDYKKALNYYKKALKIYKDNNYDFGVVVTSGNIGSVLLKLKEFDSAIVYLNNAKNMYSKLGYHRYVPYMMHNIAEAKDSLKLNEESQRLYNEAIKLFREDSNLYELTNSELGLATSLITSKNYNQAIVNATNALNISKNQGFKEFEVLAYKILAQLYGHLGDFKKAYTYNEKYAIGKDSLFEDTKTKLIFDLDKKYETEKKEKEILTQRANIAEKELNINQKNTQIIGLGVLAVVLSLLGYLLYKQQKLKNQQLQKESELKEALIKIETQNSLQEQRLTISRDLHDNIGAQLTFIISSIENLQYGFKITNEKLTNKLMSISAFTKETIYELRDTIWAMNKNEISFEDLQTRITNFIEKANIASDKTAFEFNVDSELDNDITYTSVQGMNMYRIIQEAINNALKYAEAKNITVMFEKVDNQLQISISDDGKGFNINDIQLGNGLNNMKKRAADMGAHIVVESQIDKGSNIVLTI